MSTKPSNGTLRHLRRIILPGGRPHRAWVLAAILGLTAVTSGVLTASADPTDTNPATAPVPVIPSETAAKALIAIVQFDDRTSATPVATEVRFGGAHSHLGDPPLLRLRLLDENGALLDEYNAWHPLWAFVEGSDGSERRIILDEAEGTFIVPFDRDAASMTITDIPLAEEVTEVDLTGAIRDFCEDNPTDPSCRVADLAVTRVEATSVPALSLVGETGQVIVETDVTNLGPTAPMDATVSYPVTASAGITVSPATGTTAHTLALNEVETTSRTYDVTCTAPGLHVITFASSITPSHPADVDLVATNNQSADTVTIDCIVPITIDVKSTPINVSVRNGSIPVELLSNEAGENGHPVAFDATTVDPVSARFGERTTILGGGGAVARDGRGHVANGDVTIQFVAPADTGLTPADTEACVMGEFTSGTGTFRFWGCDAVRVLRG